MITIEFTATKIDGWEVKVGDVISTSLNYGAFYVIVFIDNDGSVIGIPMGGGDPVKIWQVDIAYKFEQKNKIEVDFPKSEFIAKRGI